MSVKPLRAVPNKPVSIDIPLVGWICGYDPETGLLVDFAGSLAQGPIAARWTMQLDKATVDLAVRDQQKAVLVFEEGDPLRPIVTGLIQPLALREPLTEVRLPGSVSDARVDGKRLTFEAEDEIVLRSGQASITLRKNGAVVIRGAHVVSHSSGMNRIRGGAVHIN